MLPILPPLSPHIMEAILHIVFTRWDFYEVKLYSHFSHTFGEEYFTDLKCQRWELKVK